MIEHSSRMIRLITKHGRGDGEVELRVKAPSPWLLMVGLGAEGYMYGRQVKGVVHVGDAGTSEHQDQGPAR